MAKSKKNVVSNTPDLIIDWHPTKNSTINPFDITTGSSKKVWWLCHKCGYEWQASINNRAKGRGCSYCSKKILIEGVNDFATIYPSAAKEWDYEKNYPITPNKVRAHSNKKYWFRCVEGHNWETTLNSRKKNNCPYCGNQRVLKGYNDLATKNPELCKEWNYEKNSILTPENVMQFSNARVWWKCNICGHEWQAKINARSKGTGCPNCKNNYKVSEAERIIYYYIKNQFEDAIISYRPKWLNRKEIDIFIPSLSLGIEYDGEVWHKDPSKDVQKTRTISEKGISLIRIREENCPILKDESIQIFVTSQNYKYSRLNQPIIQIFDYINKKYNLTIEYDIDVERDYQKILALTKIDKGNKSLFSVNPKLCEEWNYEKNKLMPKNVLPASNKIVWWKCYRCGYEWRASIVNRTKGRNCPFCSNKVIIVGINDLETVNPELCKEWDYKKNLPLTPQNVTSGAHKNVWWICKVCGYEWKTSISNRKINSCPQCAVLKRAESNMKNRVVFGVNDLESQYPEISDEWHPTKNNSLVPKEICVNSNKRVWWQCNNQHEWQESVNKRTRQMSKCPYCTDNKVLEGYNDILTLYPELCKEWDYKNNVEISPNKITRKYGKKIWWKCSICGHEWQTTLRSRINGSGCKICMSKKGSETRNKNLLIANKSFLDTNPNAAKDWNYEKNFPLKPEDITSGSGKIVWWKCHKCGYEWQTSVNHVSHGTGCRHCKHQENYARKRKKIVNLDTKMEFESMSSAAKYYNVNVSLISMCCAGKTNTACGYRWKLLESD